MPVVGVISDTHGLLRPEVLRVFRKVDLILHAGDIGSLEVLNALQRLAPVIAIRGNNDTEAWAKGIPEFKRLSVGGISIFMIHDLKKMETAHDSDGCAVIVSGHSHKPSIERRGGILYLNPGGAGPRRFKLPIGVARLTIDQSRPAARLIEFRT
ncbi:MAG TPA: metallophosphoesterase family protein [Terriglobia bacterium]|jgi:hypothetical protein